MVTLKDILETLPKLKPAELEKISQHLTALRVTESSRNKGSEPAGSDWLLAGILFELRRRGLLSSKNIPAKEIKRWAPRYESEANEVRGVLIKAFGGAPPQPNELVALGRLAAEALAADLNGGPAPVCLTTMLRRVSSIPGAVDAAFPDYISCGVLSALLRR